MRPSFGSFPSSWTKAGSRNAASTASNEPRSCCRTSYSIIGWYASSGRLPVLRHDLEEAGPVPAGLHGPEARHREEFVDGGGAGRGHGSQCDVVEQHVRRNASGARRRGAPSLEGSEYLGV